MSIVGAYFLGVILRHPEHVAAGAVCPSVGMDFCWALRDDIEIHSVVPALREHPKIVLMFVAKNVVRFIHKNVVINCAIGMHKI